jgi:BirA family transcriptional regulator, biotin operon repressor / biotin---[acetyl-CoA-carboxylase] ligase
VSGAPPSRAAHTQTRIGHPRLHLRRTGSTNERARELAFAGAPHGTLVTAAEQTAGRGRQGRRWSAPAGSALLMSLLLRDAPPLLPLIAAVAVSDVAGEATRIKWPNDVVVPSGDFASARGEGGVGDRAGTDMAKLAGILVEGRPQEGWAVLGIGLNVAVRLEQLPAELRPRETGAASAANAAGAAPAGSGLPAATLGLEPADVEPMLARLLDTLERRLAEPAEATLRAWRERDALYGREVAWAQEHGRAEGIDGNGRLIVALADGGQTALGAGEVHLRQIG